MTWPGTIDLFMKKLVLNDAAQDAETSNLSDAQDFRSRADAITREKLRVVLEKPCQEYTKDALCAAMNARIKQIFCEDAAREAEKNNSPDTLVLRAKSEQARIDYEINVMQFKRENNQISDLELIDWILGILDNFSSDPDPEIKKYAVAIRDLALKRKNKIFNEGAHFLISQTQNTPNDMQTSESSQESEEESWDTAVDRFLGDQIKDSQEICAPNTQVFAATSNSCYYQQSVLDSSIVADQFLALPIQHPQ